MGAAIRAIQRTSLAACGASVHLFSVRRRSIALLIPSSFNRRRFPVAASSFDRGVHRLIAARARAKTKSATHQTPPRLFGISPLPKSRTSLLSHPSLADPHASCPRTSPQAAHHPRFCRRAHPSFFNRPRSLTQSSAIASDPHPKPVSLASLPPLTSPLPTRLRAHASRREPQTATASFQAGCVRSNFRHPLYTPSQVESGHRRAN